MTLWSRQTAEKNKRPGTAAALLAACAFVLIAACTAFYSTPAKACADPCDTESNIQQESNITSEDGDLQDDTQDAVNDNTDSNFSELQRWYVEDFWPDFPPAFQMMAEQLSATALQQFEIIGTFLDAKHQLESQRLLQQLSAEAHRDYTPSEGLCTVGTMTRSLAGTERNVDQIALVLAQRSIDRQTLNTNAVSSEGTNSDNNSRFLQFRKRYCDNMDDNWQLDEVCDHDPAVPGGTYNKDIDFYRTLGRPMTLNLDFSSATLTNDETDIFALEANLYAHEVPQYISPSSIKTGTGLNLLTDKRSIVAKRSVAENSFQAIAAMKATGQTSTNLMTAQYMRAALAEMGISGPDAITLIGQNPSYYAQMDVLTRKMFQRPEFFVDLYDKPANIERKSVALQAISLMQRRDLFKSTLRTESMLSILLELELITAQDAIQNQVDRLQ